MIETDWGKSFSIAAFRFSPDDSMASNCRTRGFNLILGDWFSVSIDMVTSS